MKRLLFNLGVFGEHGIDQAALNLLNAIPKNQYDIILHVIYELGYTSKLIEELDKNIQIQVAIPNKSILGKIHFNRKKNLLFRALDGLSFFLINGKIRESVLSINPDWIIDYDTSLQKIVQRIKFFSITFIHFAPNQLRGGRKSSLNRMGKRLSSYKKIILLCDEMKSQAQELWPHLYEKFSVIPNPINIKKVLSKSIDQIQLPIGIQNKEFFLSVGRLSEQKNFLFMIDAYKLALEKGVNWPLIIIGDGNLKTALNQKIRSLKLEDQVILLGHKDNPYPYIRHASSFLLSSDYEGFGIVLVEAMILGCPIISTNCKVGPSDILEHGNLGLLTKVGDVNQFAMAISNFYTNSSLRNSFASKAKLAVNKYDSDFVCSQIIELLPVQ